MDDFPDTMAAYGRLLYGDRWQTAIARDVIGVSDVTVRRWLSGKERPRDPESVLAELRVALSRRAADIVLSLIPPRPDDIEDDAADDLIGAALTPLIRQIVLAGAARGWDQTELVTPIVGEGMRLAADIGGIAAVRALADECVRAITSTADVAGSA